MLLLIFCCFVFSWFVDDLQGVSQKSWNIYFLRTYRDVFALVGLRVKDPHLYGAPKVNLFQALVASNCWFSASLFWNYVTTRTIENTFEQRWTIKFCTKLDEKAAEIHELLKKTYGESILSYVRKSLTRASNG